MGECPNCDGKVRELCKVKKDAMTKDGLPVLSLAQCNACGRVLCETPRACKNCGKSLEFVTHAIGVSPGWHHRNPSKCLTPEPEEKKG